MCLGSFLTSLFICGSSTKNTKKSVKVVPFKSDKVLKLHYSHSIVPTVTDSTNNNNNNDNDYKSKPYSVLCSSNNNNNRAPPRTISITEAEPTANAVEQVKNVI